MFATLSYTLQNSVLSVQASDIWRLTEGTEKNHKSNGKEQEKIIQIIQSKQCSKIILNYSNTSARPQIHTKKKFFSKKNEKNISPSSLETWDSLLLALFSIIIENAKNARITIDYSQLPEKMINLLHVELLPSNKVKQIEHSFLENIGESTINVSKSSLKAVEFLGEITLALWHFFRGKAACSSRDIWQEIYSCSAASLPIISLVSLLLGLILAFVSALQLKTLGAELYVASLVSISMVRVMGPVLTGIVVAGKTGASYAATIGTMQVNEEVDALNTFGISPIEFLVLPRLIALTIMMPFLTMYANFMGVLGGFLVTVFGMGISPAAFVENVQLMAHINSLWIGLLHSFVFGFLISLAGCYQGLVCGRSAEAVGKATTSAVVNSIVGIIVATSIITIILSINEM